MYPVSNDYKTAIAARSVTSSWYGTITTTNGDVITFDSSNMDQNKSKWITQYATGDTLEIGTAFSSQLTLTLRDDFSDGRYQFYNAEIELFFRLELTSSTHEDVPCGIFTVSDAEFTRQTVTMVAYDYMQKFSKALSEVPDDMTPYDAIAYCCTNCGVALGVTQADVEALTNGTHLFKTSALDTQKTYRDMIGFICACLGVNAIIGRDGFFYLKSYSTTPVREIGGSNRYDSSYIDYLGRYTKIALTNKDGTEEVYAATGSYDGQHLTMSIGTNPVLNAEETANRGTLAVNVINALATVKYAPCTINMPTDAALDIGDSLTISGGYIETPVMAIITKMDVALYGKTNITSAGGNYELAEKKAATKIEKAAETTASQFAGVQSQIAVIQSQIATISGKILANYILPYGVSLDEITDTDQGGTAVNVLRFHFEALSENNSVSFYSELSFNVHTFTKTVSGVTTYQDGVVTIAYIYDSEIIQTAVYHFDDGWKILTINALLPDVAVGRHNFDVQMSVQGASLY